MSFFIAPKRKNFTGNRHEKKNARKRKLREDNNELTSESEEEVAQEEHLSSEDEHETAQEKKVRLAKVYLKQIEKEVKRRLDENEGEDVVGKKLREDYLSQTGKLHTTVAHKYVDVEPKIDVLKCKEHNKSVTCVCVSSDNKFVYSGSKDSSIVKWSVVDSKKVISLPFVKSKGNNKHICHNKPIMCLALSINDKFLAVADDTKDIQIRNPVDLKYITTFTGHSKPVTSVCFHKNSNALYSCSKDKTVKVWNLDEMAYVETLYGHQSVITSIDALTKERALTSGGTDFTLRMWKIVEESQLIYNSSQNVDIVKFINDEHFISGGDSGQLSVWSVNKKKPLCGVDVAHGRQPKNGEPHQICSIGCFQNTDVFASGSDNGTIKLWKLEKSYREITLLFNVSVVGFVNSLCFTCDGRKLIAGVGREHKLGRWNVILPAKNCVCIISLLN